jgi:hypothetical protein
MYQDLHQYTFGHDQGVTQQNKWSAETIYMA